MKKMSVDLWIVFAVLTFLLVWAGLTALRRWSLVQNVQIPTHGYGGHFVRHPVLVDCRRRNDGTSSAAAGIAMVNLQKFQATKTTRRPI